MSAGDAVNPSDEHAYLGAYEKSDDETWEQIAWRFGELCSVLEHVRFETRSEAVGVQTSTESGPALRSTMKPWWDEELGAFVRPWLLAAFDPEKDRGEWEELRRHGLQLRDKVAPFIKLREVTPAFVSNWGAFCELGALFEQAWLASPRDLAQLKGAERNSRLEQMRWYAHLYVSRERGGATRKDIDGDIAVFVSQIMENGRFPDPRFGRSWYESILPGKVTDMTLSASFNQNKLPRKKSPKTAGKSIEELAATPRDDLPPVNAASYHL